MAKHKPQMEYQLKDCGVDPNIKISQLESNKLGFSYIFNKEDLQISSQIYPIEMSKRILEAEYADKKESINKATAAFLFVMDPFLCEQFMTRYDWFKKVYVVFPSADYLNTLCYYYDFTVLIKNDGFRPIVNNNISDLIKDIEANLIQSEFIYSGLKMFSYSPFDKVSKEILSKSMESILQITSFMQTNFGTEFGLGELMIENELKAIDKIPKYPDASVFMDMLKGMPVVCVAAGPSLSKNIDYLYEIKEDVYIIAAASCLKPLLKKGIKPDLVTILDMQPAVIKYLEGIETKDLNIAIQLSSYHGIMDKIDANFIIAFDTMGSRQYLVEIVNRLGFETLTSSIVGGGYTVAFMSIFIAKSMGASEIILLGQDLAMGETSHIEGATFTSKTEIETINGVKCFKVPSHKIGEYRYLQVIEHKGFFDDTTVLTTPQFDVYRKFIEKNIKDYNMLNIINCTEGGVYIEGTEHITLSDAYQKYICNNKLKKKKHYFQKKRKFGVIQKKKAIKDLMVMVDRLEEVNKKVIVGLEGFVKYKDLAKKEKISKLRFDEKEVIKDSMDKVNECVSDLFANYKREMAYASNVSVASHYLFKLMENVNSSKYSNEALESDKRNKVALLLSSVKEAMDLLIEKVDNLINELKVVD